MLVVDERCKHRVGDTRRARDHELDIGHARANFRKGRRDDGGDAFQLSSGGRWLHRAHEGALLVTDSHGSPIRDLSRLAEVDDAQLVETVKTVWIHGARELWAASPPQLHARVVVRSIPLFEALPAWEEPEEDAPDEPEPVADEVPELERLAEDPAEDEPGVTRGPAEPVGPEHAAWLKGEIARRFNVPVRYVIYSHSHADHSSGAAVFKDTARIISHEALSP